MSTAHINNQLPLPDYSRGGDTPLYSRNPLEHERRLLLRTRTLDPVVPSGSFTKSSKTGSLTLEIHGQADGISIPVFGKGQLIRGKVAIQKNHSVSSVDLKIDGNLRLQQVGGAGTTIDKIVSQQLNLWSKDDSSSCPSSLDFTIPLRESYDKDGVRYPLPPTYEVHLSGVPGFRADVLYSMTVTVTKNKGTIFGNHTVVSTPFIHFPRARPQRPIPIPPSPSRFLTSLGEANSDWEVVDSVMTSRSLNINPILTKLYVPAGRTFCVKGAIPFRLHIASSALSLATFLPCSPTAYPASTSRQHDSKKGVTRVYALRQASVDVQKVAQAMEGTKTDIFKVIAIGEGSFKRLGDGADWAAWEGEIVLDQSLVKVGSFKAGGLWVKDCLVLSIIPPNPHNSPLVELRTTVPIRIVTESHASDADFDPADWSDHDTKYRDPSQE